VQNAALSTSGQRLISLGIHPIAASAPLAAPAGNRRGTFAATPQGKTGAAGTPDIAAGQSQAKDANGGQSASSGMGAGKRGDIPPGLHVGAGPESANRSAVGGSGQGQGTGGNGSATPASNSPLVAKLEPPRVSAPPRRTSPASNANETDEEKQVFGGRKFYAMTVNTPNLNSGGGSWVLHFAELNESADQAELSAPSPSTTADPAYPLELMRQNVRGTVTLYAVIRKDGSVGEVRVLSSADDRLDAYAQKAFARWHFHPATKNGNAVDLAAVVMIPFRPAKVRSSF
jgi:TonB family protein